uniref:PadR family transcriptional regulator n=1 Tax=Mesoaciditoga lauensis TaxID=1495039 RepID=A0A7V3RE36_9BACT
MYRHGHGFGEHQGMRVRFIGPFLLLALYQEPSYGYELMERLKNFGFEMYMPDQTAIYKMLRSMEEKGFVSSRWDTEGSGPAKRMYDVTALGVELLKNLASEIKDNIKIYENFIEAFEKIDLSENRKTE